MQTYSEICAEVEKGAFFSTSTQFFTFYLLDHIR